MKSANEAVQTAKNVVAFPKPPARRQKDEIAFLPAALEIVETPPSPIGRAIGATLIAVFCLGLIWACFGHVDIVATATGKIVPSGRVKLIQPFETGVVRAIHIRDGKSVKAGEVLIELDPTMSTADEEHIRNDLNAARLDVARLRAALSDADDAQTEFHPLLDANPTLVKMQKAYLAKQVEEHRAKVAALNRQRAQKQAERDTAAATIQKLEASSPIIKERVDTVIVTGCNTSGCIRAAAIDSFSHRYRTVIPEDCVGDLDERPHHDNLRDVGRRYADISDLASCVAYIEEWSQRNAR